MTRTSYAHQSFNELINHKKKKVINIASQFFFVWDICFFNQVFNLAALNFKVGLNESKN